MDGEELIRYCELHCETPRALFVGAHINRMIELADFPDGFPKRVNPDMWQSVHEPMAELCRLARIQLRRKGLKVIDGGKEGSCQHL